MISIATPSPDLCDLALPSGTLYKGLLLRVPTNIMCYTHGGVIHRLHLFLEHHLYMYRI